MENTAKGDIRTRKVLLASNHMKGEWCERCLAVCV